MYLFMYVYTALGSFSPLSTLAMDESREGALNTYTCLFIFCAIAFVTTIPYVLILGKYPVDGSDEIPNVFSDIFSGAYTSQDIISPMLGAGVWTLGLYIYIYTQRKYP